VLLVRPDHIGDVLLTSPAVALLRASLPDVHLTYLVGPWSAEAARRGPDVDAVETLEFPAFTRRPKPNVVQPYAMVARETLRLRVRQYDIAVIFRPDHWWGALLAMLAQVPARIGAWTPENAALLSHTIRPRADEHAADQSLRIARLALKATGVEPAEIEPRVVFRISERARSEAAEWWRAHGLEGKRVVALQPSAGATLKSWPEHRWAELADRLDTPVLLMGAPTDHALLRRIDSVTGRDTMMVAGQRLELSAALLERCALLVAPDSGAAHLAAAVGTPTVRLYGPAPASKYGPWPIRSDQRVLVTDALACVPCGHLVDPPCGARGEPACMLALGVNDVLAGIQPVLARGEN
jgi:heptosyltransferase-2/heptosyltransferase-3